MGGEVVVEKPVRAGFLLGDGAGEFIHYCVEDDFAPIIMVVLWF